MVMSVRSKRIIIILFVGLVAGGVLFLRGPYMSNFLKALILPEVQSALGRQVIAHKMYVNLLPLFIEAKGVKAFNEKGERVFSAESVKAYIGLSKVLKRQITLETIVIKNPQVWLDRAQAEEISRNIEESGKGGKKFLSMSTRAVVLREGEVSYYDEGLNGIVEARGLNAEVILRERPEVNFSVAEISTAIEKWPELKGHISGNFFVGKESIEFKRLNVGAGGSNLSGTGFYSMDGTGMFRLDLDLLVSTVKDIMGLKEPGYGSIHARGALNLTDDILNPYLDLNVDGDFYLETLLEAVRAKTSHRLTGLVSFSGKVKGRALKISGTADARLRNSNLYTVDIDDLTCKVAYADRMLSFTEGKAKLYGGTGAAKVSFPLPSADPYSVEVDFSDVDSPPLFERIGMDWLQLPFGKVNGRISTSGSNFDPEGWAVYEALEPRDDPIGRIQKIGGKYRMRNKILTLTDMEAFSGASRLAFGGTLNTRGNTMDFNGGLVTEDVSKLMTPYFGRLTGSGEFQGNVSGPTSDPLVKGRVWIFDALLDDYPLGDVEGEASYRKNLLTVKEAGATHEQASYSVEGTVAFPKALKLLELREPDFDLRVGLSRADLGGLLRIHNVKVPVEGSIEGEVNITQSGIPEYLGSATVTDGSIYGYNVPSASLDFSYNFDAFTIKEAALRSGDSVLSLNGSIAREGDFNFRAGSEEIYLRDVLPRSLPLDYRMSMKAEGKGTVERPEITLEAVMSEGKFGEWPVGEGTLKARLKEKDFSFDAKVFEEKMALKGQASLEADMPWSAELDIIKGRYDFLLSSFIKEVPEDMMFNITGKALLSGDREHVKAAATLKEMTLAMYGQSFSNDNDIVVNVDDGKFTFPGFKLRSGNASVNFQGSFGYNDFYDIMIDGTSSLAPLKAFSDKISLLRGEARFVLALQGDWEKPGVNGGIDITDGSFGLESIPQRLASINGYSYFEDDTVVIERLGAKLGGGDIELSGVLKLSGFNPRLVNLDMLLNDVDLALTKGFKANLGGNIIYRGTPRSKLITGEVAINRAEYTDRLEWKTWLLKIKRAEAARAKKGLLDDIKLSVRLYGTEGIVIDNNMARARLKIDTILRGTIGEPLLLGRIESTEGKVYFRNHEFRIAHATADFSDTAQKDPYMDIVAETAVKGYNIWLTLEGRLQQLDLTLLSDPELEDVEILALLAVGEFGEGLKGLEGGIGAAEASSIITGGFQDVVEERLRDLTGITRFTVDPYVSRRTGAITPRVTVSKRLAGEDLFVTYSSSMSTSEEQEVMLEYVINRNVSLLGGQDDLGSLGGDIRFRFFFK